MSEYSIRNTDQTLNKNLIQLAAKLAKNTETEGGKSISERESHQLLSNALNNDGTISEEEIKFIAGLKVEKNVSELKAANFEPKGKEIKFKDVTESTLNDIRKQAYQLSASYHRMSSVEAAVKKNESLIPFFNSMNDWSKSYETRKEMVSKYKDAQGNAAAQYKIIADLDFFSSGILPLPNEAAGMKKYMIEEVQKSPMNGIMSDLCDQIKNGGLKHPQKVFDEAFRLASKHKAKDPKRAALFAMAMLGNELHNGYFDLKNEGLRGKLRDAYIRFNNIDHKDGSRVVMSHNVVSNANTRYGMDFSEDNNFHFWSHAFMTYEMLSRGYSEDETRRFSAFVGAEHELRHMTENYGNAALKDVIINAYGAEFGVLMFLAKGTVPLPKVHEGPQVEDRTYHTGQGRSFQTNQGSY